MRKRTGAQGQPIAIVGMAFRFPGDLGGEHQLWQALKQGRDLVTAVPEERWATGALQHPKRSEPGKSITFSAGVLSRIDEFDAEFFGISPREAAWLDPQQRLLLELAWEAMENAGQLPSAFAGSDCSVYVGISGFDYAYRNLDDLASMSAYSMTGNTLSLAANRLSYVFDLHGPSLAVDTACSSSLVALHHACNSLHSGESSLSLVGGVNLLSHPFPFIGFTKASMLSANGRCRAFDNAGDGYVRAEGGAVFLLKRLDQALADGDEIHALILATGANADGSRKTGITIPSSAGQAELMRTVMKRAGIQPAEVDYVEAHGTGTAVGDPIEAAAIGAVYGQTRAPGQTLPIGSIKTNLGHLEPASGMAGLVKAILVLKNQAVPPSLHLDTPNSNIDFTGLNLDVVTEYRPLPQAQNRPLVAGVNSFGFGGANAHVLVQQFIASECELASSIKLADLPAPPLFLSARSEHALRELAGRYASALQDADPAHYYDIAYGAAFRRESLEKALALSASNSAEAVEQLERFALGESATAAILEDKLAQPGEIAFIYSGNGAQWAGMGVQLLQQSPRFATHLQELDALIEPLSGFSVLQELQRDAQNSRLDDTAVAQPLLFAIQVALTLLLRERGIEPAAVAGHSVGEVAAAWAAGALSLQQAVEVICSRSASQALTRGCGRMAAVSQPEAAMRETLALHALEEIEIVGFNSPGNLTLAGSFAALDRLGRLMEEQGVFFRLLDLDYAFHSPHMDAIATHLVESLAQLKPNATHAATFVSTVTGEEVAGHELAAHYWWRNVREPVHFSRAISTLVAKGCRIFVEIGPHAILQRYIGECLAEQNVSGRVLPTLRREEAALARIDEVALRLHMLGAATRRTAYFPQIGRRVRLPNYPWQRERHWLPQTSEGYHLIERRPVHPLLGWRLKETDAAWENTLDPAHQTWLGDHKVGGAVVLPGAAYVEMALAASREWSGGEAHEIEELDILAPVVFDGEHARTCRFELSPRDGSFTIRSRQRLSDDEWTLNAVGRLLGAPARTDNVPVVAEPDETAESIDQTTHYRLAATLGLDYGPVFRGLKTARVGEGVLYGQFELLPELAEGGMILHPAQLDVCFQSLVDFFQVDIETGKGWPLLPVKVGRLQFYNSAPAVAFQTRLVRRGTRSVTADFLLLDAAGYPVALLSGCRFRAASLQRREHTPPACWQIAPQLTPHVVDLQHLTLPAMHELAKQLRAWFNEQESSLNRSALYTEVLPLLDALTLAFAYDAFKQLAGEDAGWLQQTCDNSECINTPARPFFRWLLALLQQENLLRNHNGRWQLQESDLPPADEIWRTLLRDYPVCMPELILAGRTGRNLSALISGQIDAAAFASQLHNSTFAEKLYLDSPIYQGTQLAVQQLMLHLAQSWPAQRRLRVLEISPAQSETPRVLAEHFNASRLDYVLAQADDALHDQLKAEYSGEPHISVAKLEENGLSLQVDNPIPEQFDVVILQHWLHGTANPAAQLAALRSKLASGGVLILAERHPDLSADFMLWADMADGYQSIDLPPMPRLFAPGVWQEMLAAQQFEQIETLTEPASQDRPAGAYLLLAKQPQQVSHPPQANPANWLLLTDGTDSANELAESVSRHLTAQGQQTHLAAFSPATLAATLVTATQQLGSVHHVVQLAGWSDTATENDMSSSDHTDAALGLFQLVRILADSQVQAKLWLVTPGGALAATTPGKTNPVAASLWGLGRVIMNEYPQFVLRLIDISAADPVAQAHIPQRLCNELLWPDAEAEILLSDESRYGLRLQQIDNPRPIGAHVESRFRLDFFVPGQLRNLKWLPQPERPLGDEEVEVKTCATGLNFRDVMYLMGLLPDEAVEKGFAGASLGLECAGVVTRVGARVRDFAPGDAVMGFGSACFSSHVVTQANALAHKPSDWSFESAATVPTVFFTVYYALKYLANLQPGERVLIHGGAGGVGIAAIQLARHLGAEIYATAGSEEKRDFVRLLGADHVLDSRSLDYAEQILALTQGEGVDVVLNSLAGEAIRRNLQVLKPFGRFLELGKRDFFENTPIGLRPFKDNISYFGIDADQLLVTRPDLAGRLFREVMALFRDGVLSPLPYRAFTASQVVDAFRTMQQSRHIGKIVVSLAAEQAPHIEQAEPAQPLRLSGNTTWLVTGGVAGFGLESARWLAQHGVTHLVLLGRRGMQTPGASEVVAEFKDIGATARIVACDVSNRASLQAVLDEIQRDMPPLRGVLHAAMVLDDALLTNLDTERFSQVLAPKLSGAHHLHELTQHIPLDHFILYSSVTTLIGNPGQANYVAANAYLEGLASQRHSQGLPALCIGWGPIGDAGYLTRNQAVRDGLAARLGAAPFTTSEALAMLEKLLPAQSGPLAVANFDWPTLSRFLPSAQSTRFSLLRQQAGQGAAHSAGTGDFNSLINGKSAEEITRIVHHMVTVEVAQILCISADRIDPARSLHDLGLDSLMGVELALSLEKRCGVQLPAMLLNEGPTVDRVAARISEKILTAHGDTSVAPENRLDALVATLAAQHGETLSGEDMAQTARTVAERQQKQTAGAEL